METSLERFYITGQGRTGTAFLSSLMNSSATWTVLHEPDSGHFSPESIAKAHKRNYFSILRMAVYNRFRNSRFYGEVNSQLRWFALPYKVSSEPLKYASIPVDVRGLLIRDTYELVESMINKKSKEKWNFFLDVINEGVDLSIKIAEHSDHVIYFKDITTDLPKLNETLVKFGVTDVTATQEQLTRKVNSLQDKEYSLDALSTAQRKYVDKMSKKMRAHFNTR